VVECAAEPDVAHAGVDRLRSSGRWPVALAVLNEQARQHVGRAILLGLEVLIIAAIVQTITIDPTLKSALTLALIVLVRTFLSFSLEIDLEGTLPWRRGKPEGSPEVST
jgi:hypothetical protein